MTGWLMGPSGVDPAGDAERLADKAKNRAKVGSGRPSSLMYTYGPGAIMDLPHFTVMPAGFDAWDRIWARRPAAPSIHAPRLLDAVRKQLGRQVLQLRPFPYQPETTPFSDEGRDLGVPALVFPQWLRCTGCDLLAPLTTFTYSNTHPYRPDLARFVHEGCPGRRSQNKGGGNKRRPAVPARYLLACTKGHLDEFCYDEWVHHGKPCPEADIPRLAMEESTVGRGASAKIRCRSCQATRGMNEAQGSAGQAKLPTCRGRHPHLNAFDADGCGLPTRLMLVGASNLWFPILQSVIVMPMTDREKEQNLADQLRGALGEKLATYAENLQLIRDWPTSPNLSEVSDHALRDIIAVALSDEQTALEQRGEKQEWSVVELMAPEWAYLQRDPAGEHHEDEQSGLTVRKRERASTLPPQISRVLAVEKLRQASALVGFTRIDELDRIEDEADRQAPLSLEPPEWAVAVLNHGEGVFLQFDELAVANWEARVRGSSLWAAHVDAHRRNFHNRLSETATVTQADDRMRPPRYWLLHTLSHVLLREMAMSSGYGAASISERIYAWPADERHPAAAGILLLTTSSDSDGTLGGLVQLSEPARLSRLVHDALHRARRCSSDPVCAHRTPRDPEDFLHGAACHCCVMASETSCERANRFLDRRFLVDLPGDEGLGFFQGAV